MSERPKDDGRRSRDASKVPTGRLSRFLSLGAVATRMAAGGAAEKVKRLSQRARDEVLPHALLTAKNAQFLAARLSHLRGAAMKVGQMLSLEGDNMLPPEFAKALELLRSSAHQMPQAQVRQVLRRELGQNYEDSFESIDYTPLATASIGQVHRAVDLNGRRVALKIQYPGVAESIDSDVDNLRMLLSFARLLPTKIDLDAFASEIKRELHYEVDYERERLNLGLYFDALKSTEGLWLPQAFPELSSKRVLAMSMAPGITLLDWSQNAHQTARDKVGEQLLTLLVREFFEMGLMQTDPNPANYFYDEEKKNLVLLDFGSLREVPEEVSHIYRRAFRGLATRDEGLLRGVVRELGLDASDSGEVTDFLVAAALDAASLFQEGFFDFATSDLSDRLKSRASEARRLQKRLSPPPPRFVFFQRKLAGTYLLCRQLSARVDCHAILKKHGVLEGAL